MQAIRTTFVPGTNDHPTPRYQARAQAGRVVIDNVTDLDFEGNHRQAALTLAHKLGWLPDADRELVSGGLPDGSFAHVFADRNTNNHEEKD